MKRPIFSLGQLTLDKEMLVFSFKKQENHNQATIPEEMIKIDAQARN